MAQDFDLELLRGRLRAQRFGDISNRVPALCIPGLSSNSRVFNRLGAQFERDGHPMVAFDLRGRGWSDITEKGTYGWENHARDILEAADAMGIERFDYVGHSMGAFIGMAAVALDRGAHIRRLVLIDGLGVPAATALSAILAGLVRLKNTFATADEYVSAVREMGLAAPWNDLWEAHYRYDLITDNGNVRPRTDAAAVGEDAVYGGTQDPRAIWPLLTVPTLLLRATVPLGDAPDAFVVTKADYDDFLATVPTATGVEISANHFGIMAAQETLDAIERFLQ
ncbi:MAG TPA: alpha/beta fold hydrolase [Candidatus Acidoferrum sp.]|jgi:pimeloyl-ACP methyl ester carboxylesterase|nr:alpha/beta fold hydrolase [Candidatus Acidoferrum sp.]